jgi:hypothetical protein
MRRWSGLLIGLALSIAAATGAWADGPSGSHEDGNQLRCGIGTDTPAGRVYAGPDGVELCNDIQTGMQVHGRVIVGNNCDDGSASGPCPYLAIDGASGGGVLPGTAYFRLDSAGLRCANPNGTRDATRPDPDDGIDDCHP